jgi:hypothetical protein
VIPEEQSETETTPDPTDPETASEVAAAKAKSKRASEKPRRTHADRAMASLRAAKRGQREVSDPAERARFMLAEANVLALLDVAEALGGPSAATEQLDAGGSDGAD